MEHNDIIEDILDILFQDSLYMDIQWVLRELYKTKIYILNDSERSEILNVVLLRCVHFSGFYIFCKTL